MNVQYRAHQVGREQGLEVEEQPSAGNLLQPLATGFLRVLMVLRVRGVLVLPVHIVELNGERITK